MTQAAVENQRVVLDQGAIAGVASDLAARVEHEIRKGVAAGVAERLAALKADVPAAVGEFVERSRPEMARSAHAIASALLDLGDEVRSAELLRLRDEFREQLSAEAITAMNNLIDGRPGRGLLNALTLAAGGNGEAQAPAADSRREPADVAARVANEDGYAARQFSCGDIGACEAEVLLREVDVRGRDGELDALRARVHALILPLDMRAFLRDVARITAWADARSREAGDLGIADYMVQAQASNETTEMDNPPHFKLRSDDLAEFKRRLAAVARAYTLRYAAVLEAYAAGGVMPRFGAARCDLPA